MQGMSEVKPIREVSQEDIEAIMEDAVEEHSLADSLAELQDDFESELNDVLLDLVDGETTAREARDALIVWMRAVIEELEDKLEQE